MFAQTSSEDEQCPQHRYIAVYVRSMPKSTDFALDSLLED